MSAAESDVCPSGDLESGLEAPVILAPLDGATIRDGYPTLCWTAVDGATGYVVTVNGPDGAAGSYATSETTLVLRAWQRGAYTWSTTPCDLSGAGPASSNATCNLAVGPWKFGVIPDTQWTLSDPAGQNPNSVAVSIITQVDARLIAAGVKFVVAVGDLTDNGSNAAIDTRARVATNLYRAGVGFFPLRGNHEATQAAALQFTNDFPQTQGVGSNVFNAAYVGSASKNLQGLSYALDYNNARLVLLDQFTQLDGGSLDGVSQQVPWVGNTLTNRMGGTHAFVFGHRDLMGERNEDCLLDENSVGNKLEAQNAFYGAVSNAGVRYVVCGHDHTYQRSMVASPDGASSLEEVICGSDCSKYFTPRATNDVLFMGQKYRETSLAQDLYRATYLIFTVDGPRVTAEYYASTNYFVNGAYPTVTPPMAFVKRETFGYSLNGTRFLVPQGSAYTGVADRVTAGDAYGETYVGTSARILSGTNGSTAKDYSNRQFMREVSTGWAPGTATSDVLRLWGMQDLGSAQVDVHVLSMSYQPAAASPGLIAGGWVGLLARATATDTWANATDLNAGGTPSFVLGPWSNGCGLGSCGVDTNTATAWAVVNHAGDFMVGVLPHKQECEVQALPVGRGTVTPGRTNVAYLGSLAVAAAAADGSFISDIQTNGATIGGRFGMVVTNFTWRPVIADGMVQVFFADVTVTNRTPVWWLQQHHLTNDVPGGDLDLAALADPDHDGLPNWMEFRAGTNPTNAQSVLAVSRVALAADEAELVLEWSAVPGLNYDVQCATNLADPASFVTIGNTIPASDSTTNRVHIPLTGEGQRFFRIRLHE